MQRIKFVLLAFAMSALTACATHRPTPAAATASPSPSATATATAITPELEQQLIGLEKKSWEYAQKKQAAEYRQTMAPGYRAIYLGGIKEAEEVINDLPLIDIKRYELSDFKVRLAAKDTAILTYKLKGLSVYRGKEIQDALLCSAVWVNLDGEWKAALYTESADTLAK